MKIGNLREDGTRTPLIISFVELWKMLNEFSSLRQLLRTAARQGRKENTVTTFEIHSGTLTAKTCGFGSMSKTYWPPLPWNWAGTLRRRSGYR